MPRGFNPAHSTNSRMNDYENASQVSRRDSAKRFLFSLEFMIRHIVPFSDTQSNGLSPVCVPVIRATVDRRYEKAEGQFCRDSRRFLVSAENRHRQGGAKLVLQSRSSN